MGVMHTCYGTKQEKNKKTQSENSENNHKVKNVGNSEFQEFKKRRFFSIKNNLYRTLDTKTVDSNKKG